ncbi:MAG: hypothetical protein QGH74_03000 [Candidatus Brocadiia bacterium]|jgi:hypothetical protein|nr:hypothetical protein [Candidatus Brocadiia bacterium]
MFMTPRGLKIRLDIPRGFTLLARLWQKDNHTDAFRVLKTCEGLEYIPSILGFVAGLIGLVVGSSPWHVLLAIVLGTVLGKVLTMFGMFRIPRLPPLATLWSWAAGYGIFTLVGVAASWLSRGWEFAAFWVAGHVAAFIASTFVLEPMRTRHYKERMGYPLTQSEINFFNAYRLRADRLGVTRDTEVSDSEVASGGWQACLEDYETKYPEAVARFLR